jgi:hypothetical protein
VKCIETRTPVYLVKDDHGEILEGTVYAKEIQKVIKQDDVYKIQSVLKKRRKGRRVQYLVKWLGYLESFNSWIYKSEASRIEVSVSHMAPSDTDSVLSSCVTCGKKTPRSEVVFLCQVLTLYTVIVVSIYNLTVESENSTLWTALLSSCLGYLLPNPTIESKHVLSDITQ